MEQIKKPSVGRGALSILLVFSLMVSLLNIGTETAYAANENAKLTVGDGTTLEVEAGESFVIPIWLEDFDAFRRANIKVTGLSNMLRGEAFLKSYGGTASLYSDSNPNYESSTGGSSMSMVSGNTSVFTESGLPLLYLRLSVHENATPGTTFELSMRGGYSDGTMFETSSGGRFTPEVTPLTITVAGEIPNPNAKVTVGDGTTLEVEAGKDFVVPVWLKDFDDIKTAALLITGLSEGLSIKAFLQSYEGVGSISSSAGFFQGNVSKHTLSIVAAPVLTESDLPLFYLELSLAEGAIPGASYELNMTRSAPNDMFSGSSGKFNPEVTPLSITVAGGTFPENTPPALKGEASATATVELGNAYTLDLSTVFEDADGDELTYTVAIDGAEAQAADKNYRFTSGAGGEYTLVFNAFDGTDYAEMPYTVTLSVTAPDQTLEDVIAEAEALNKDDYTQDSWENMELALGIARTVAENPSSSATLRDLAQTLLENMMNSLVGISATWEKLAGSSQYDTMAAIVTKGWESADTVILATGTNFPDALSASGLAGVVGNAPIVLTDPYTLSEQAKTTISALAPSKVIIIGGKGAISDAVKQAVEAIVSGGVERVYGQSSIDTARAIYQYLYPPTDPLPIVEGVDSVDTEYWGDTAIIARGDDFADALSIAPFAYANKFPIFQVASSSAELDSDTLDAIAYGSFSNVIIVGGKGAVNQTVEDQLANTGKSVERWSGKTLYDTSAVITENSGLAFNNMAVATGKGFPDALAGAALCGKNGSVLCLVDEGTEGSVCINGLITQNKDSIRQGYFLGGNAAVTPATQAKIKAIWE